MSTQKLIRELRAEYPNAVITFTRKNHLRVEINGVVSIVAGTPSDRRHMHNVRSDIRRKMATRKQA
jgi:hypothetical protein